MSENVIYHPISSIIIIYSYTYHHLDIGHQKACFNLTFCMNGIHKNHFLEHHMKLIIWFKLKNTQKRVRTFTHHVGFQLLTAVAMNSSIFTYTSAQSLINLTMDFTSFQNFVFFTIPDNGHCKRPVIPRHFSTNIKWHVSKVVMVKVRVFSPE